MFNLLQKFISTLLIKFGVVSALGFALDAGIFYLLTGWFGVGIIPANGISSFVAVTYVYLFSSRRLFMQYRFSVGKYALWVSYQCILILSIAVAIRFIANAVPLPPVAVKLLLMPLSFAANFLVIRRLCA